MLTPELALRIGLAARALQPVPLKTLMNVLVAALQMPLTDAKLKSLTLQQLRVAAHGKLINISRAALREALAHLKDQVGVDIIDPTVPHCVAYDEGDMPGSVRIAVATQGGEVVNGHFGKCPRFLIYQVAADETRLIGVRGTASEKSAKDKHQWRVELVADCNLVLVMSVGVPDMARLMKAGIYPVKYPQTSSAGEALDGIRRILSDAPPPWLGKLMGQHELARKRTRQLHLAA